MIRRWFFLTLTGLALAGPLKVAAQSDAPKPPAPKTERTLEELRREVQKLRDDAAIPRGPDKGFRPGNSVSLRWGGLQAKKVDAELQEKLGLPDNEGLLVTGIDAGSLADKAGLKVDDVLVKINDKAAPGDPFSFASLIKEQKQNEPMNIMILRDGKEQTLKGVPMSQFVQATPGADGGRPNKLMPRGAFGPRRFQNEPGALRNMQSETNVNGVRIRRTVVDDLFTGEYAKEGLKIAITGKIADGSLKVTDVTIQEGKESKKYANVTEVPLQYRIMIQQLLPSAFNNNLRVGALR